MMSFSQRKEDRPPFWHVQLRLGNAPRQMETGGRFAGGHDKQREAGGSQEVLLLGQAPCRLQAKSRALKGQT